MNLRIGRIGQLFAPGYGWCMRCETPWRFVRNHVTDYGDRGHGCFPLCEKCWAEMNPQRRIPFYHCLIWAVSPRAKCPRRPFIHPPGRMPQSVVGRS